MSNIIDSKNKKNYVYILSCNDDTLYTGWTTDLKKRLKAHNEKKGAKYTKNRTPVRLVYYEIYDTKQEAMKREYAIKQLTRVQKIALIEKFDTEQFISSEKTPTSISGE